MPQPPLDHDPRRRGRHAAPRRLRSLSLAVLAALAAAAAAGCGSDGSGSSSTIAPRPIAFESCGRTVTLDRAPRRVVILNDGIADTLFALGVGDTIVAKTRGESTPAPELKARLASLPSLGTRYPNEEALLAAKPDLLVTDQAEKVSGEQGAPSSGDLERAGIATYVVGGGCAMRQNDDGSGIDALFADIRALGAIFDVPERADALAERLRGRLEQVRRRTAGEPRPDVAEMSQVAGQLYVTAGGLADDVIGRAGGRNLFAGLSGQFAPISSEQVVARNPQAIVIDDFTGSARARRDARAFVTTTFATTDAVKQRRILVIDAARTGARGSTRPIDGVVEIARFLHPGAFGAR